MMDKQISFDEDPSIHELTLGVNTHVHVSSQTCVSFVTYGSQGPGRKYLWSVAKQVDFQLARKMPVNLLEKEVTHNTKDKCHVA